MKARDDASGCGGVKVGEEDESATTLFFMDNEKTNSYARYILTTLLCKINTKSQSAKVLTWPYLSIRPPKCPSDYADLPCFML